MVKRKLIIYSNPEKKSITEIDAKKGYLDARNHIVKKLSEDDYQSIVTSRVLIGAPIFLDHNPQHVIGKILDVYVGPYKDLIAEAEIEDRYANKDMQVSIGYKIHYDLSGYKPEENKFIVKITKKEPFEASLCDTGKIAGCWTVSNSKDVSTSQNEEQIIAEYNLVSVELNSSNGR